MSTAGKNAIQTDNISFMIGTKGDKIINGLTHLVLVGLHAVASWMFRIPTTQDRHMEYRVLEESVRVILSTSHSSITTS